MGELVTCKYCGSQSVQKHGFVGETQKYLCTSCGRRFSADDRLYRMKTSASEVADALTDYYDGKSIAAICHSIGDKQEGRQPSTKTVYTWIDKYTQAAIDCFKDYHPEVGDTWIADETVLRIDGANVWLYDIIDEKTRFMLASRVATARTTEDARSLMEQAAKVAGKHPKVVITDQNNSYLDGIELAYGSDAEHRQGGPFVLSKEGANTSRLERFHGTLKSRTKTMRGLKSLTTAQQFADGFLAYYNFLRPHEALDNRTPAEAAGIGYPVKTWQAVTLSTKPQVEVLTIPAQTIIVSEQLPVVRPILHRHYKADKGKRRLGHRKPASQASLSLMRRRRR